MAYLEAEAQAIRDAVSHLDGITERKMFGGLCFMLNGNMLCGVNKEGGMARVGKELESAALELDGVEPLSFTGRRMGGMVDVSSETILDSEALAVVLSLAIDFVGALSAK
jgi:TfoX/Sxy family transcriptional regulator of competence genes